MPEAPALFVGTVWDTLLDGTVRTLIERDLLAAFLHRQPWFQGPRPRAARFRDWGVLRRGPEPLFVTIVEADIDDAGGGSGTVARQYFLPLALVGRRCGKSGAGAISARRAGAGYRRAQGRALRRAGTTRRFAELLLEAVDRDADDADATRSGAEPAAALAAVATRLRCAQSPAVARRRPDRLATQSLVKLFRRVEPGVHPEIEVTQHLIGRRLHARAAGRGALDYARLGRAVRARSACLRDRWRPRESGRRLDARHGLAARGCSIRSAARRPAGDAPPATDRGDAPPAPIAESHGHLPRHRRDARTPHRRDARSRLPHRLDDPTLRPRTATRDDLALPSASARCARANERWTASKRRWHRGRAGCTPESSRDARTLLDAGRQ